MVEQWSPKPKVGRSSRFTPAIIERVKILIYLKNHHDGDLEYINANDIFRNHPEEDPKTLEIYGFLSLLEKELNYFNNNNSTAFGNPDLSYVQGQINGYCMAKGWIIHKTKEHLIVCSGNRKKFVIERPKIPQSEIENRRDIRRNLKDLGF